MLTTALNVGVRFASAMPLGGVDFNLTSDSKEGAIAVSNLVRADPAMPEI